MTEVSVILLQSEIAVKSGRCVLAHIGTLTAMSTVENGKGVPEW